MTDQKRSQEGGSISDHGPDPYPSMSKSDNTNHSGNGFSGESIGETGPGAKRGFLEEVIRRIPLLQSVQSGTATAVNLSESVDMSRSTVHRATNSLTEYGVLVESEGEYELTDFGELILEETKNFSVRACSALKLKQFLNSADINGCEIPVEHFLDADITRRKPRQPHTTIHRIIELLEQSDSLRMLSTVISPVYVDVGYREMMDGMRIEAVFEREVLDIMLSEFPNKAQKTIETGVFDVYEHDDLPFELFIFDDKIGMAAHNEHANAEVLIECDHPSAIEWAEDIYAKHLSEAEPLIMSDF